MAECKRKDTPRSLTRRFRLRCADKRGTVGAGDVQAMSYTTDTDARKVAEAQCYAPDDGSDPSDPSWIEPRNPEDCGDPIDEDDDGWGQYGEQVRPW